MIKNSLSISFFLFFISVIYGQDTNNIDIIGRWKILRHHKCLHVNIDDIDKDVLDEYNNWDNICLNSIVTIDTKRIQINPSGACGFIDCEPFIQDVIQYKRDSLFHYPFNRCDNVVKDSIVQSGIHILCSEEIEIIYFNTNCSCGMDDCTYRIIILDRNRIAFFSGINILILERMD